MSAIRLMMIRPWNEPEPSCRYGSAGPRDQPSRADPPSWIVASARPQGIGPESPGAAILRDRPGGPIHAPIPVRSLFIIGCPRTPARPWRPGRPRTRPGCSPAASPLAEPCEHRLHGERVEDIGLLQPTAA